MGYEHLQLRRRRHLLAALILAPAAAAALALTVAEVNNGVRRARRPSATALPLADAMAEGDLRSAYAAIAGGLSPNDPIPAYRPDLTGESAMLVSPVLWAVALQNRDAVLMLLSHGARLSDQDRRRAACLARELGNDDIARAIAEYGGGTAEPPDCAVDPADVRPPLVRWSDAEAGSR
jgi:hypothetical protein